MASKRRQPLVFQKTVKTAHNQTLQAGAFMRGKIVQAFPLLAFQPNRNSNGRPFASGAAGSGDGFTLGGAISGYRYGRRLCPSG
jgi:hypothetical protein